MNEIDKVQKWQDKIIETFKGPSNICGEKIFILKKEEDKIKNFLLKNLKGFFFIMDAFFDFSIETLQNLTKIKRLKWPKKAPIITVIQVVTFWRFRASYIAFYNGYYIDATSLLRAIYENVLLIAALRLNLIEIDDVFGKLKIEDSKEFSEKEIENLIRKYNRESESKINSYFFGKGSGLSSFAKKHLKIFKMNLHNSVHKCKVNFFYYYGNWSKRQKNLPIFPEYNEDLASFYTNSCMFIAWIVLRTLPFLQVKYKILDESFREMIEGFPKPLGRAMEELVEKKFTFN